MKNPFQILTVVFLSLVLFSCKTYNEEELRNFDRQIKKYLEQKNIKCTKTDSGLYYNIIEPGVGDFIQYNDKVSFLYKGYFLDGEVFDQPNNPISFEVKKLISAWKEIMLELKPGAKAFLVSPPQLAYGDRQLDDIPPNSILVYEIEVKSVE